MAAWPAKRSPLLLPERVSICAGSGANTLRVSSDLNLRSPAKAEANPSGNVLPVDGSIHATYDGRGDTIAFRQSTLRVSSTTLALQGDVSKHSNLQVDANVGDIH